MADTTLTAIASADSWFATDGRDTVEVSRWLSYRFFIESDGILYYRKSTDGELTWAAKVQFQNSVGGTVYRFSLWFDRWNGGSGGLIYVALAETGTDNVRLRTLNVATDALGTAVEIFDGTAMTLPTNAYADGWLSLTKVETANLLSAFRNQNSASSEAGFYRSTDGGVNWTSRTSPWDGAADRCTLLPKKGGGADAWALYVDTAALAFTLKEYSDGGNSWAESATIKTLVAQNGFTLHVTGVVRQSDGHIIAMVWTDDQMATGDCEIYDITDRSTWTQKTNVLTNSNVYPIGCITIDQVTGWLYVTLSSTAGLDGVAVNYVSKDGGTTWLGPYPYMEGSGTGQDLGSITGCYEIGALGGVIAPTFWLEVAGDLFMNHPNRIAIVRPPTAYTPNPKITVAQLQQIERGAA